VDAGAPAEGAAPKLGAAAVLVLGAVPNWKTPAWAGGC